MKRTKCVGWGIGLVGLMTLGCGGAEEGIEVDYDSVSQEIQTNRAYTLTNVHAGKCLDVAGRSTANGANVQLWDCSGATNQQFTFEPTGGGYYLVRNVNSGKCL